MKLTICILTSSRPLLFERCIDSVLKNHGNVDLDIVVNNDTHDITELYHPDINIKYMYETGSLLKIYKLLYTSVKTSHMHFLEDDDYLTNSFFDNIDLTYDINFIEYTRDPRFVRKYIDENGMDNMIRSNSRRPRRMLADFIKHNVFIDFQLSQIVFKKDILNMSKVDKYITDPNDVENDEHLFYKCLNNCEMKYIKHPCYVQTTDSGNNLSDNLGQ